MSIRASDKEKTTQDAAATAEVLAVNRTSSSESSLYCGVCTGVDLSPLIVKQNRGNDTLLGPPDELQQTNSNSKETRETTAGVTANCSC